MKLAVLVPSEAYRSYAGARIRYSRVAPQLEAQGVTLELEDIAQFNPQTAEVDGIIVSKCHDGQSLLAAAAVSRLGKLVGVDLFDDYFSQTFDSRLTRYRNWLSQLVELCDFALCSTQAMADVVHEYRRDLPAHIMNDPAPAESFDFAAELAERKAKQARDNRCLRLCWFGVGDNPYFPVGLQDLTGFAAGLPALSRGGYDVSLTVVTNPRALSADGLAALARLPVSTAIREWSETAEQEALQQSHVAFLPVSAQRFSVAKSLNRAITALSNGCQVLSAGYPLYDALDALIYREPETVLADLERGAMRFAPASEKRYAKVVASCASAATEAKRLSAFLSKLRPKERSDDRPLCLVHGHSTRQEAHNFARQVGALSVASPFCAAPFDFDLVFRGARSGLKMLVAKTSAWRLLPKAAAKAVPGERLKGKRYLQISGTGLATGESPDWLHWERAPISFQLATYRESMKLVNEALADAVGPCRTFTVETRPVPFPLAGEDV